MNDTTGSTGRDQERTDASRFSLRINLPDVTIIDDRNLVREDPLNADTLGPEARNAPIKGHLKMFKRGGDTVVAVEFRVCHRRELSDDGRAGDRDATIRFRHRRRMIHDRASAKSHGGSEGRQE